MLERFPRLFAFGLTLAFFVIIWFYVKEFKVFSNTIEAKTLVLAAMSIGLFLALGLIFFFSSRFKPAEKHLPEIFFILITCTILAPLPASLINRSLGGEGFASFEFVAETPFYASGYGLLKGEKAAPNGYLLTVREQGKLRKFKYKRQAYYPNTKPGESVLLPLKSGLFGARVIMLE